MTIFEHNKTLEERGPTRLAQGTGDYWCANCGSPVVRALMVVKWGRTERMIELDREPSLTGAMWLADDLSRDSRQDHRFNRPWECRVMTGEEVERYAEAGRALYQPHVCVGDPRQGWEG